MDFSALKNLIPGYSTYSYFSSLGDKWNSTKDAAGRFGNWLGGLWDDWTGKSAVDLQNEGNLKMAKYQSQMEEELYNKYRSPQAIMRQYAEAGLNPNLIYGSASAGIGSSPHFNAPHVERNLSGQEKVNTALSAIAQVLGLKQAIYQTDVAREAAQQAAIRTADDSVKYRSNAMDYVFKSDLYGADVNNFREKNPIYFSRSGDTYSRYLGEFRASKFNEWFRKGMENQYDFGGSSDYFGNLQLHDMKTVPYFDTRNRMSRLRYSLLDQIGNTGTYGKLVISLLDLLK